LVGRYVTALNNLGDAYEKAKNFPDALSTYQEALNYAPNNKVAASRVEELRGRV
jgi:tetratricopeptide (TPR) repeat protein